MTTYTIVYRALARNLTVAQLTALLALAPLDLNTQAELGLTVASDVTASSGGNQVARTIIFNSAGNGPIADPFIADILTNIYTSSFRQFLISPVTADAVIVI